MLAALERAFQTHAEKQKRDVLHLQEVMTLSDARYLRERTGIGAHPSEILQILGLSRSAFAKGLSLLLGCLKYHLLRGEQSNEA